MDDLPTNFDNNTNMQTAHPAAHNDTNRLLNLLKNTSSNTPATFTKTGTVLQTIFNVTDYGAIGDGITDDTSSIQNCIEAARAVGGGIIFFPTGLYLIFLSLFVGGGFPGGLILRGSGWDARIKLANNSNCYIFDFGTNGSPTFTPGLVIEDLYLDANGAHQSSGGQIFARGAVHCIFSHIYFSTPWEAGIRFYQDGTGSYGHHNTIIGCYFENGVNSNGGHGWGIKFEQADENRVIGCTFQNNGNAVGDGQDAHIYDTNAGLQSIIGNAFVGSGSDPTVAFIKSVSNPGRMMISNNAFDTTNAGDFIYLSGEANTIVGNTFLGIGNGASSTIYGINLSLSKYSIVTGNSFYSNGAHAGAVTDSGGDYNSFGANTLDGVFASGIVASGAHDQVFDDGSGNMTIYGSFAAPNVRITAPSVPASAGASGSVGSIAWDSGFIYVCVASNTWKRVAIATW